MKKKVTLIEKIIGIPNAIFFLIYLLIIGKNGRENLKRIGKFHGLDKESIDMVDW